MKRLKRKRKSLLVAFLSVFTLTSNCQTQLFAEPFIEVSQPGVEEGVKSGINIRNSIEVSFFIQRDITESKKPLIGGWYYMPLVNNEVFSSGVSLKAAILRGENLYLQPMLHNYIQLKNKIKIGLGLGVLNTFKSFEISVKYGVTNIVKYY